MKKLFCLALCLMLAMACVPALADGDTYTVFYGSEISTLNYLITSTSWDQAMATNIVDCLVEYNNLGEIIPCLAESWENSEDGLSWTFHLRPGVKWYDCFGEEVADVTAGDFVAAMKYILTPEYESAVAKQVFSLIANAEAYYNGEVTDFAEVGVKAVDDATLVYTLNNPVPYFLSATTYVTFMPAYAPQLEELGVDFGLDNQSVYYCGAYILEEFEQQDHHLLVKNANYWDADNVHIAKIHRLYNAEAATLAPEAALRGEVDSADIDNDLLDMFLNEHPEMVSKGRADLQYSYFYCFNFDPQYEEEYDPANWLKAVNNKNFRLSIMKAFDRVYTLTAEDAENPAGLLENVITPPAFSSVSDGTDYVNLDVFNNAKAKLYNAEDAEGSAAAALQYKEAAVAELTAAGVTFPVKVVLTYKGSDSNWANQVQLVKNQLEGVLGTDYVEFVLYAGPSDNFLSSTRRAGKYSFMRCNWGADYADPETWSDPFAAGNNYNFMDKMLESDYAETVADLTTYYEMVEKAKAEVADMDARYQLFAEAEAFLIENALVIPYRTEMADYQVTKIDPYEGEYASFGLSNLKYKFQHLQDHFITPEENAASFAAWQEALNSK